MVSPRTAPPSRSAPPSRPAPLIDQLAQMAKADGDAWPIGQIRGGLLAADPPARRLGLPGVTAQVTITAALEALEGTIDTPGPVDGSTITAGHVRELLQRIGALGLQMSEGGSLTFAITDTEGRLLATATPEQLARLARRGCRAHPDGNCACPVLDRPPPTSAHSPTDAQNAWVTTRDRTCRFPDCGQRVGWTDLDHVIPHSCGSATDCANLCCLCRSHHRLRTLARGWRFEMAPDGVLQVTTPSRTTRPPGLHAPAPDLRGGSMAELPPPDDDPPPF